MIYKHLSYEQRVEIRALQKADLNQGQIAKLIGVDKTTISRELKRNTGLKGYRPKQAHQRTLTRKQNARKHIRLTDEIIIYIKIFVGLDWSPEQISNWLRKNDFPFVSHETIYQFIIDDQKNGGLLYKHLRQGRRKRRKRIRTNDRRGQIPNRVSIDQRPDLINNKERIGDWEIDTIIGNNHKGAIVTAVERKTKFSCMKQVPKKEAALVASALIEMLKPYEPLVLSLTSDNGKEFSFHEKIAKELQLDFYFAHPYSSWERGLNENTNGLIRQYFPKKTSFINLDQDRLMEVQYKLNQRPRKSLDFETPESLFSNSLVALET